jgi:hypothetical protein
MYGVVWFDVHLQVFDMLILGVKIPRVFDRMPMGASGAKVDDNIL